MPMAVCSWLKLEQIENNIEYFNSHLLSLSTSIDLCSSWTVKSQLRYNQHSFRVSLQSAGGSFFQHGTRLHNNVEHQTISWLCMFKQWFINPEHISNTKYIKDIRQFYYLDWPACTFHNTFMPLFRSGGSEEALMSNDDNKGKLYLSKMLMHDWISYLPLVLGSEIFD